MRDASELEKQSWLKEKVSVAYFFLKLRFTLGSSWWGAKGIRMHGDIMKHPPRITNLLNGDLRGVYVCMHACME